MRREPKNFRPCIRGVPALRPTSFQVSADAIKEGVVRCAYACGTDSRPIRMSVNSPLKTRALGAISHVKKSRKIIKLVSKHFLFIAHLLGCSLVSNCQWMKPSCPISRPCSRRYSCNSKDSCGGRIVASGMFDRVLVHSQAFQSTQNG